MEKINNFLVGSDPEWFLVNHKEKKFVPSEGLIGGTKDNPRPVGKGFFVQEDNLAAEGNIPPAKTKDELVKNIETLKDRIRSLTPTGVDLYDGSMAVFTEKEATTKQGLTFGCEPDINAYSGLQNPDVCASPMSVERFAGAHVWIGYDNARGDINRKLVKLADLTLGVPSVIKDKDTSRREMYGKAGAYREKWYGVEYRSLSNFWTMSKENIEWVYDGVARLIQLFNEGIELNNADEAKVVTTINAYDKAKAEALCRKFNLI